MKYRWGIREKHHSHVMPPNIHFCTESPKPVTRLDNFPWETRSDMIPCWGIISIPCQWGSREERRQKEDMGISCPPSEASSGRMLPQGLVGWAVLSASEVLVLHLDEKEIGRDDAPSCTTGSCCPCQSPLDSEHEPRRETLPEMFSAGGGRRGSRFWFGKSDLKVSWSSGKCFTLAEV